jgi:hypothetical protein
MWEDTTTYSNQKNERQRVWGYRGIGFTISVIRGHRYYPNRWIVNCHALGIKEHVIGKEEDMTPEQAQSKAVELCRDVCFSIMEGIKKISDEISSK